MRYPTVYSRIGLSVCVAVGLVLTSIFAHPGGTAEAREGNRTLKLYFGHTKERGEFTFKRNGRYDRAELARINRFLRDWRRNEPANMDPKLLDLIWAIYRESGSRDYIHVVSAYRSPATNKMLRSRSGGVAEKSQHVVGKAMDWYVTDVPLAKLRAIAMRIQGGGVGYYPRSGSPFIHTDTGNVRAWPRMSRAQLVALFPDGETLHLPADGKPLPGYQRALARRKAGGDTALAYLEAGSDGQGRAGGNRVAGWLKKVFDGGADQAEDDGLASAPAPTAPPAVAPPAPAAAPSAPAAPPAVADPQILVAAAEEAAAEARLPRARPQAASEMMVASLSPDLPSDSGVVGADAIGALAQIDVAPLPRSRPDAAMLADSLNADEGPAPLVIDAEDAIAALAARAEEALLAEADIAALPESAGASAEPSSGPPPVSAPAEAAVADRPVPAPAEGNALAAANSLAEPAAAAQPAPVAPAALAFAGSSLRPPVTPASRPAIEASPVAAPPIEEPAPAAPPAAPGAPFTVAVSAVAAGSELHPAPVAMKGDRMLSEPAVAAAPPPAAAEPQDADELARLITERAKAEFSALASPQPADAPGLFAVPETAAAIAAQAAAPKLPTLRFQPAEESASRTEESFFSRLFANLTE